MRIRCKDCGGIYECQDIDRTQKFIQCPLCSAIKPNPLYEGK